MTGVQTCALPICFPVTIKHDEVNVVYNEPIESKTSNVAVYKIQDLLNTIKNYCRNSRSWAAMDEYNRWYRYDKKPILMDNKRWARSDYSSFCRSLFNLGLVPENVEYGIKPEDSLITPNGEWYKDVKECKGKEVNTTSKFHYFGSCESVFDFCKGNKVWAANIVTGKQNNEKIGRAHV